MQPSQQHVSPCVKGVEWGLGTRGLRISVLGRFFSLDCKSYTGGISHSIGIIDPTL